jgi:hypothetical protein
MPTPTPTGTPLKDIPTTEYQAWKKQQTNISGLLQGSLDAFVKNEQKYQKKKLQIVTDFNTEELKKKLETHKRLTEIRKQMFESQIRAEREHYKKLQREQTKAAEEKEKLEKRGFKAVTDKTEKLTKTLEKIFTPGLLASLNKFSSTINEIKKQAEASATVTRRKTTGKIVEEGTKAIGGDSARMSRKQEQRERDEFQFDTRTSGKKTANATTTTLMEQLKFFSWYQKWEKLKLMIQIAKMGAGAIAGLLGKIMPSFIKKGLSGLLGKSKIGRAIKGSKIGKQFFKKTKPGKLTKITRKILSPKGKLGKFFGSKAGRFLGGTKGGVGAKLIKSGLGISGAIGGIKGLMKGISEFGAVAKKEGSGMAVANVAKNLSSGILSGLTMGLVSRETFNKMTDVATKWTGKLVDALSPSQDFYNKMSEMKTGLSERSKAIGASLDSIMEKTGIKGSGAAQMKSVMADKEKWNKLTKEEQDLVKKRVEGAEKRQKAEKAAKPPKSFAQGTAGTGTPSKTTDLFREAKGMENITIHGGEKYAVLNKDQWDKVKGKFDSSLPTGMTPTMAAGVDKTTAKSINKTMKTLGGAVKNLLSPKKPEAEKKNQDEDAKKYGGSVAKGAYVLKDTTVDITPLPFKARLEAMIAERFKLTGKKTQINSGFRSLQEQERVYKEMPNRAAKPGRSPHGPPNPRAVDMNSSDVADMVSLGLIQKYGFKFPVAKTKSGEWETWHIQAQKGAYIKDAPKEGRLDFHKNEGLIVDKPKAISAMMQYAEMGKKVSEMASGAIKDVSYAFTKDMPGKAVKGLQRGDAAKDNTSEQMVKLLTEIKSELETGRKETKNQKGEEKGKISTPATTSASAGTGNFTQKENVFPSDTLMTNMYAMMTQFSGGY